MVAPSCVDQWSLGRLVKLTTHTVCLLACLDQGLTLSLLGLCIPENMRRSPNVVSMLGQRRRRWNNIDVLCLRDHRDFSLTIIYLPVYYVAKVTFFTLIINIVDYYLHALI